MVSIRRQNVFAAILFYLFLWRQSCLALYIDSPLPLHVPEEGSENCYTNVANFCPPSSCFTYSYGDSHVRPCGTNLGNPQSLQLVPNLKDERLPSPFTFTYSYDGTAATDPLRQRHLV